jgi:transcriptional regulator of arginine metabolism
MKRKRQSLIISLIEKQPVQTQEQLADLLMKHGISATQATISRDIKELRLVKVACADGNYRYSHPNSAVSQENSEQRKKFERTFSDYVQSIQHVGHLVVVKTQPGSAPVVASAVDNLRLDQVIGTIAGDDTILIIVQDYETKKPLSNAVASVYNYFLSLKEL